MLSAYELSARAAFLSERLSDDMPMRSDAESSEYFRRWEELYTDKDLFAKRLQLEGLDTESALHGCSVPSTQYRAPWAADFLEAYEFARAHEDLRDETFTTTVKPQYAILPFCPFITWAAQSIDSCGLAESLLSDAKGYLANGIGHLVTSAVVHYDGDPSDEAFFSEYPVLARLLMTLIRFWQDNTNEFFRRMAHDLGRIKNEFGINGQPQHVSFGQSDRHNGGKTVALVSFSCGEMLVYKPRSLVADAHFKRYAEYLQQAVGSYRFLDCGTYGYEEYVPFLPTEDYPAFYRNAGVLLAILHSSYGYDAHYENVIAHKDQPVLVDCETAASAVFAEEDKGLLRTALLPLHYHSGGRVFKDYGALTHCEAGDKNIPNGVTAREYCEDVVAGFESSYNAMLGLSERLPKGLFSCDMRFIFRSTDCYLTLIDVLTYDKQLKDGRNFSLCIERLSAGCCENAIQFSCYMAERRALERLDVPYLTIRGDSKDLYDGARLVEGDCFSDTVHDTVQKRLDALNPEALEEHECEIRLWLNRDEIAYDKQPRFLDADRSLFDNHYKQCPPHQTVERIQGILKTLGIRTTEHFREDINLNSESLRLTIAGTDIGQNGKGVTREYARASAYAEFIERLQNDYMLQYVYSDETNNLRGFFNYIDEAFISAQEFVDAKGPFYDHVIGSLGIAYEDEGDICSRIEKLYQGDYYRYGKKGMLSYPYLSLFEDKTYYLPKDMVLRSQLSSGMCCGNTQEEALIQGFSEIFERYAQRRVIEDRLVLPEIELDEIREYPESYETLKKIDHMDHYEVILKDASICLGFPVIMLIIINKQTHTFGVRLGAHPDRGIAIERCITEAFQGKTLAEFSQCSTVDLSGASSQGFSNLFNSYKAGYASFPPEIFMTPLDEGFTTPADKDSMKPADGGHVKEKCNLTSNEEILKGILDVLKHAGYEVLIRDTSLLDFPCYHIVIPGLSQMFDITPFSAKLTNSLVILAKSLRNLTNLSRAELELLTTTLDAVSDIDIEGALPFLYLMPLRKEFLGHEYGATTKMLAVVVDYVCGKTDRALDRLDRVILSIRCSASTEPSYYAAIRQFLMATIRGFSQDEIKHLLELTFEEDIVSEVLYVFGDRSTTLQRLYPSLNCFGCSSCELAQACDYRIVDSIKREMKRVQLENSFDQSSFIESMEEFLKYRSGDHYE